MLEYLHLTITRLIVRQNKLMWLWSTFFELVYMIFKMTKLSSYLVPSLRVIMLVFQLL